MRLRRLSETVCQGPKAPCLKVQHTKSQPQQFQGTQVLRHRTPPHWPPTWRLPLSRPRLANASRSMPAGASLWMESPHQHRAPRHPSEMLRLEHVPSNFASMRTAIALWMQRRKPWPCPARHPPRRPPQEPVPSNFESVATAGPLWLQQLSPQQRQSPHPPPRVQLKLRHPPAPADFGSMRTAIALWMEQPRQPPRPSLLPKKLPPQALQSSARVRQ